jgi:hypothetical protein
MTFLRSASANLSTSQAEELDPQRFGLQVQWTNLPPQAHCKQKLPLLQQMPEMLSIVMHTLLAPLKKVYIHAEFILRKYRKPLFGYFPLIICV